jgi:hypothetical protein
MVIIQLLLILGIAWLIANHLWIGVPVAALTVWAIFKYEQMP